MSFWVYIVRCADDSYYTGHTEDLEYRLGQHQAGAIPGCYTFTRRPVTLIFSQDFPTRIEALEGETKIKRWSRAKKEALAAKDWERLSVLAKNYSEFGKFTGPSDHGSTGSPRTGSGSTGSPRTGSGLTRSPRTEIFKVVQPPSTVGSEPVEPRFSRESLMQIDLDSMRKALALAACAEHEDDEIPVGALLVDANGNIIGEGWNRNITEHDPTAHAEIIAMRQAGKHLGNHRLIGCTLYVTLEPCAMCAMAMVHARLARVVFAANDPKTGAAGSVFNLLTDPRHNHRVEVQGGVLAEESGMRLTNYFRRKRGKTPLGKF